jgi:hypothetical protein
MITEISVTLTGMLKTDILVESWPGIRYPEWSFPNFAKGRCTNSILIYHGHFLPHHSQAYIQLSYHIFSNII